MTDYKQKVIEAIQGWMLDDGRSEYDLYNRLASHLAGEFPEEKFNDLLLDREVWSTRGLLLQCKRIWDEQEAPSTNDLEGGLWVLATAPSDTAYVHFPPVVDTTPKGTCPKCGGSGDIPTPSAVDWAEVEDCPTCGGTGECQHKGDIGWINLIGDCGDVKKVGPPICFDCKQEIERRSGEERRVKSWHGISKPTSIEMQLMRENPSLPLDMLGKLANLMEPNRRTKDRRK